MAINVDFRNQYGGLGSIEGSGIDEILGSFAISGTYNEKAPYPCDFVFNFGGNSAKMDFNGWRETEKGGVFGTFKGPQGSGSFAFSPAKEGSEVAKKAKENAVIAVKTQLLSMGFEEWVVEQAVQQTTGLEPALSWITQQLGGSSKTGQSGDTGDVDETALSQLLSMGFDQDLAKQALKATKTVEEATNWIFDHM